jgi:hypothetical protein
VQFARSGMGPYNYAISTDVFNLAAKIGQTLTVELSL